MPRREPVILSVEKREEYAAREADDLLSGPMRRRNWTAETRDAVAAFLLKITDDEKLHERNLKRIEARRRARRNGV